MLHCLCFLLYYYYYYSYCIIVINILPVFVRKVPSYVGEFSQCITTNLAGCPDVMKTPLMTSYNQDAEYYESLIKHCTPSKITT